MPPGVMVTVYLVLAALVEVPTMVLAALPSVVQVPETVVHAGGVAA